MNAPLPMGWLECRVKDIGEVVSGGTPDSTNNDYWDDSISWITPADLSGYTSKYISKGRKSLSIAGYESCSAKLMPRGSVLFSSRAPIGYVAIAANELCTNQGFKSIIPNDSIESEFLFYALKHVKQKAIDLASGTTFLEISGSKFSEIPLPLPPLNEQRRIVAKLEALLSELEAAVAQLQAVQAQLSTYRQAVLKAAFEGRLTAAWRAQQPALPTAAELLEQIAAARAEQAQATGKKRKPTAPLSPAERAALPELPEGWAWVRLGDVAQSIQYGYTESSSKEEVGPRFLRITDIQDNGVKWDNVPYCKIPEEEEGKYLLEDGDLVFARTGATVGKSYLITGDIPKAVFASYLIRVRLAAEVRRKYISYYFNSLLYWKQIFEGQLGIGQPNVNGSKLSSLLVPISYREEQHQIVREIESRLSVADQLAEAVSAGLRQAEALRQSLLQQAFSGRLVPQDPTDEPASALLARLRAAAPRPRPARGRAKTTTPQP